MRTTIYSLIIIFLFSVKGFSQNDSTYFNVGEFDITQKEKGKDVTYIFKDKNFVFIKNDSVQVSPSKYKYTVSFSDIQKVNFSHGSNRGTLIAIGFGVGAALGLLAVSAAASLRDSEGTDAKELLTAAFGGGILFAILGGIVSTITTHENNYDISKYQTAEKKKLLIKALRENKIK